MQRRLPGVDPPQRVRPAADRAEPVLWVRRLRVLRDLQPGKEHVIQDVELRRGLNIIWAPPEAPSSGNALFRSGVAGHTAGKSTLCRFLRYALGESTFASETTRRRIREKLSSGWLLAEVVIEGRLWTVARPFGVGRHSCCIEGGGIDDLVASTDRSEFQIFLDAIETTVTSQLPASRFPTRSEVVRWAHVLPWLSRDQECRFADFLEWRHSTSGSDAPVLIVDERQFLVRSVLGLITEQEREEQERNAKLVAEKKRATQKEPLLAHQAATDHARVQRLLQMEVAPPSSGLFGSQARSELNRRREELAKRIAEFTSADQRASLQAALERTVQAEALARRDLEDSRTRLAMESATIEQLTSKATGEKQTNLFASLPPPRDYCNVPMALARERGCPLASTRPADLAERRGERTAAEELDAQREVVQVLESTMEAQEQALKKAETATQAARRAYLAAATAYDEQRGRLLEEQALLQQVQRLVEDAEDAWTQSTRQAGLIGQLAADIDMSYARQEELRKAGRQALGKFSATFDYVLRAVLGDEVEGRVETSGRGLDLIVEHRGQRESAALATLKLVSFDLAALTESVQGCGCFPRFLVHDGPREADMAPDIYERIFLYARQLEQCFQGEPSFQYIVTTTTQPPVDFLTAPWMRLKLAGAPAEERLLRMDL
jgi:hypothetical protein